MIEHKNFRTVDHDVEFELKLTTISSQQEEGLNEDYTIFLFTRLSLYPFTSQFTL